MREEEPSNVLICELRPEVRLQYTMGRVVIGHIPVKTGKSVGIGGCGHGHARQSGGINRYAPFTVCHILVIKVFFALFVPKFTRKVRI